MFLNKLIFLICFSIVIAAFFPSCGDDNSVSTVSNENQTQTGDIIKPTGVAPGTGQVCMYIYEWVYNSNLGVNQRLHITSTMPNCIEIPNSNQNFSWGGYFTTPSSPRPNEFGEILYTLGYSYKLVAYWKNRYPLQDSAYWEAWKNNPYQQPIYENRPLNPASGGSYEINDTLPNMVPGQFYQRYQGTASD